jgi:tryptophan-rich sensory protein
LTPVALDQALTWLQNLPLPTQIRESEWMFPTIETAHVFALVLVIGSIVTVDLRLLGFANRDRPFSQLAREMLPWTWTAFVVAAIAGALMFTSKALTYAGNIPFRIKMLCLLFAGLNMLWFHWVGSRHLARWDASKPPPRARFAGAVSLLLWTVIVATGRWIGFTT